LNNLTNCMGKYTQPRFQCFLIVFSLFFFDIYEDHENDEEGLESTNFSALALPH